MLLLQRTGEDEGGVIISEHWTASMVNCALDESTFTASVKADSVTESNRCNSQLRIRQVCTRHHRHHHACFVMASSHRQHRQDKTVFCFNCLVGARGVNWIGDKTKTVWDWKCRNTSVQSRNAVWTESCLIVLTQFPIPNAVTYCDVIWKLGQD